MTKKIRKEDKNLFFILIGKICTLDDYKSLRAILSELKQNTERVIVDLNRVTFTSSEGLGIFVSLHKSLINLNTSFYLFKPRGEIREAIELSSLDLIIPIINSDEELHTILHNK